LFPIGAIPASNCVTKTYDGIVIGKSFDDFTSIGSERYDGGAYQDLKNQLDPKAFGFMLWLMTQFDETENPDKRNIIEVTEQQKSKYLSSKSSHSNPKEEGSMGQY
jgi:hypothetical protein